MVDHTEEPFSLGWWIRRRRKALDLTQSALADCVGCAEVTIRKLEADARHPSHVTAERLADCLEISPDDRDLFLQIACGERSADCLPIPLKEIHPVPRSAVHGQMPGPALPLDTVPMPAPLPCGSRMPLRRNPLFVGRDADLRQLAQALHGGTTAAIGQREIAAATGLGGIGKTQLACEFVYRYGQCFPGGVFWLSFADPAAVPAEVAACGGDRGMRLCPEFDHLPLHKQVQLVQAAWESHLPRLLVFDNCEDEALLDRWRPTHGGCRVLLTSRRHHWDMALGVQPFALDVLPRAESIALLCQFRPDLPDAEADLDALAETLGDLPLALHLAGSFLAKYRHALTLAQYLDRLRTPTLLDDRSLREAGLSPTQHVQHVARTFEQSYALLDPADPTDAFARTLLAHATYFAPGEPLPRWLLLETLELADDDSDGALLAEDALTRLIDLALLETDDTGALRLHRLVAVFVQAVLVDTVAQAAVEATILRVADALNEQRDPRPLLAVHPHLRFVTEAALAHVDARTADLCNALSFHLWLLSMYPAAQVYLERALAIRRQVLGEDHPDTARSLNSLGVVLDDQGQYAAAQDYHEQALAIRRRVLGEDHPDTASSVSNLGVALRAQGQYAAAQDYHEQALAIWRRVLGEDHPNTAGSLNNLGVVLQAQGQYAAAQDYHEQALAIRQRVLGEDHPDIASSLNNLGVALQSQGQYAAAQDYHEQALAIRQRVLGEDHPDIARSLHSLGAALKAQGQYAAAQDYLDQALVIRRRVLGEDHPDTAQSFHELGELLHMRGEAAQARHYLEQALAIFEQRLGPQHPDTDQTRRMLTSLDASRAVGGPLL